jgi:hypothetical protein
MTDTITRPRAVAELVQDLIDDAYNDGVEELERPSEQTTKALNALFAALAEPEHIHTCGPDCQKPPCVNRRREIAAAVEAEREAICPIVYGLCVLGINAQEIVNAIRARGSK